jgi:hypothetical protein
MARSSFGIPQINIGRCAVCGPTGKEAVVAKIFDLLSRGQAFSVASVESFWKQYRDDLCYSCQTKLDSLGSGKAQAVRLLDEAVRLNPANQTAKKNLEVARKL